MTQDCRLYLITPPRLDPAAFRESLAAALDAGDVACLQLRLKDASPDAVARATEALMPVCHARDVAFILNDDAILAHRLGCDGAHLGQQDGDHAGALHEVATAGNIVVEDGFDRIAAGSRVFPAAMLLAMQSVSVVLLFLVGDPAVDDGPSGSRVRHDPTSSG